MKIINLLTIFALLSSNLQSVSCDDLDYKSPTWYRNDLFFSNMMKFLEDKLIQDNLNNVCSSMTKHFAEPILNTIQQEIDWQCTNNWRIRLPQN